jgi:hypothetical protein
MKELYKRTATMFFCLRVLISSCYVFADVSQRRTFFDSFEDGLGAWQITSSVPNTVEVATDKVHSGTKSVKFNYQDGSDNKYLEALHSFPSQTNIVLRGWFYDDLSSTKGIAFGLRDTNSGNHTQLGVMTAKFANTYFIRHNSFSNMYDTGILRSQGWHLFEVIVTPQGSYGKIDNKFLANFKNTVHTQANQIGIYATWNLTSASWFDDIDILVVNQVPEEEIKSLIGKYLYLYRSTDFSPLYSGLGIDCDSCTGDPKCCGRMHGNDIRSILDLAYALILDWKLNNNQDSLTRAAQLISDIVNYGRWSEVNRWSVAVPAVRLFRTSAIVWDYLPEGVQEKILLLGESLGNEFLGRQPASGYVNDTRAEDNAWNAAFLATLSQFYNSHVNASLWEEKGKCFAWHSITTSTDQEFCGVRTQTVYDDFQLDNHNRHPNPVYTGATIVLLAEGALPYHSLNKSVPQEFKHNVAQLFQKLLTYTVDTSYHYEVNGQPFSDWSGVTDTFYYPSWGLDFINSENLGGGVDVISLKNNVFKSRSLFYADILSELVEQPLARLEFFDQRNRDTDSYKFFLNSHIAESLVLNYFWCHPQGTLRSLRWQAQEQNVVWQPFVWSGGPLINYDYQDSRLFFYLHSQQPSNCEVYSSLINVERSKGYFVSYQVKTENLQGDGQYPASVLASEYNINAKETDRLIDNRVHDGRRSNIPTFSGTTGDWQIVRYKFTTTNETAYVRLRAMNAGWGTSTGKAWFRQIKIKALPALRVLLLKYPTSDSEADLNEDGKVNGVDFGIVLK